jgi:D-glycero-D-manno-heptose 1,7-bisphosphate phosphatase
MPRHRALFLDRDGVVNRDGGYVHRIAEFEFIPPIFELCRLAAALGYTLVIVTNQSGIARGLYGEAEYQDLTAWMLGRFRDEGIAIAAVYHCPYHPTEGVGAFRREHPWRKPQPGMLLEAAREHDLDLARSILIGDQPSDIAAARAAGIGRAILIAPGGAAAEGAHRVVPSLAAAMDWFEAEAEPK